MSKDYHIIRDPVHGFIKLQNVEEDIINSVPFQRLRFIRQLALTNMVYPGAEHSRFSHSLGVMEMATKVFDTLIAKHSKQLRWKNERIERNRQLLRLVALLHDIGHAPFSHASEELFKKDTDHETYTEKLIGVTPIADIINGEPKRKFGITADEVSSFFSGENIEPDTAFLKEIYSGECDVDKMDYLLRDSLYTGVHYGKFDYDRLINTLCLIPNQKSSDGTMILAIEEGGVHALEALVLARYFMFTQVYFHRVRRAYDHHLISFLIKKIKKYPVVLNKFLKWDDNRVFVLLKEHQNKDEDAKCVMLRSHYVEAFSTQEHPTPEEITRFQWLCQEIKNKFQDKRFFIDVASKAPHQFNKIDFFVKERGKTKPVLINKKSKIVDSLQKIEQRRVLTRESDYNIIQRFSDKFWLQKRR